MILITTAGKVGTRAALTLATTGQDARVLVRDPRHHQDLQDAGVELVRGDLDDITSIEAALDGVGSIVLVSLAVPQQELHVVDAAKRAGVDFIVKATSKASSDSPIERRRGQAEIEAGLEASGIQHALLRSNAYMQNLLVLAPAIAQTDGFASSTASGRIGLIDARDVGEVAAAVVAAPEAHVGATYWLTGPELLSYRDVAGILTDVLGRQITFTPRTGEEDEQAMIAAGVPAPIAAQNAQAFGLVAHGDAEWLSDDLESILHRTPRSFRDFAMDHRAAFGDA